MMMRKLLLLPLLISAATGHADPFSQCTASVRKATELYVSLSKSDSKTQPFLASVGAIASARPISQLGRREFQDAINRRKTNYRVLQNSLDDWDAKTLDSDAKALANRSRAIFNLKVESLNEFESNARSLFERHPSAKNLDAALARDEELRPNSSRLQKISDHVKSLENQIKALDDDIATYERQKLASARQGRSIVSTAQAAIDDLKDQRRHLVQVVQEVRQVPIWDKAHNVGYRHFLEASKPGSAARGYFRQLMIGESPAFNAFKKVAGKTIGKALVSSFGLGIVIEFAFGEGVYAAEQGAEVHLKLIGTDPNKLFGQLSRKQIYPDKVCQWAQSSPSFQEALNEAFNGVSLAARMTSLSRERIPNTDFSPSAPANTPIPRKDTPSGSGRGT